MVMYKESTVHETVLSCYLTEYMYWHFALSCHTDFCQI